MYSINVSVEAALAEHSISVHEALAMCMLSHASTAMTSKALNTTALPQLSCN
jgi:hypothetical protein